MAPAPPNPTVPTPDPPANPKLRRRWRRRVAWTVGLLVLLVGVALVVVTRPIVLTPLVSRQLSGALGADVGVQRAVWRWRGGLELHGLTIDLASDASQTDATGAEYGRLLEIQRLDVGLSPTRLLGGDLDLRHIEIETPVLRIVEDPDTGSVNLRQWLLRPQEPATGPGPSVTLPEQVRIANGRIAIEALHEGERVTRASMHIDGTLTPDTDTGSQTLLLEQIDELPPGHTPLRITGTITSRPAAIKLEVADFDLTQPIGVLASPQLRALWSELDPDGALPTLRAEFADDGQGGLRLAHAELVLKGLAVTVPIQSMGLSKELHSPQGLKNQAQTDVEPLAAAPPSYAIRMTEVDGRFVMQDQTLGVQGVTGVIEGLRYHVDGEAVLTKNGALKLDVRTDAFELPEDPPFILRLPAAARQIYHEYQPRGGFRAAVTIEREPGQPVGYIGQVDLIDARAVFHKFAYPIQGLNGRILFDQDGLAFRELEATGPNGGRIVFRGMVTDPGPQAKADVTIALQGVPVDEHLLGALNDTAQDTVRMFMHRPSWRRFAQRGLITDRTAPEADGAPLGEASATEATPAPFLFGLQNRVNGNVRIVRDPSLGHEALVTTTVKGDGLQVMFEHFPYPMHLTGGELVIRDTHIDVDALRLRGPEGMTATVNGQLTRAPGEPFVPDLRVTDVNSPVNRFLLAALPAQAEETLRDLSVLGDVSAQVRVEGMTDGEAAWHVTGTLEEGSARPYDGAFSVTELHAKFDVNAGRTKVTAVTGRHGTAVIDLSTEIPHQARHTPDSDAAKEIVLDASATNLVVGPALLDLLPPDTEVRERLAALFARFEPTGRTEAALRITWPLVSTSDQKPRANAAAEHQDAVRVDLRLEPRVLSLVNQGQRVAARDITGTVHAATDHIRVEALKGQLESGWAQADGVVGLDGGSDTALTLSGQFPADAPLLRAALPPTVNAAITGLELGGPVAISDARLLRRAEPGERPALEFDAAFAFEDNTARLGVPITDLQGTLDTAVRTFDHGRPTELRFELHAPRLRASNRLIAPLTASLTNVEHPGWLAVERVTGRVYGGTLTAKGGLPLDGQGNYRLEMNLQDTALGPFLDPPPDTAKANNPDDKQANAADQPVPAGAVERSLESGVMSASLTLEADMADADSRRGRGAVLVRNAQLFQRQGGIGLLRVLNFAAPSSEGLDRADARFIIEQDTVRFDHLEVAGPGLEIKGTGTMTYPDTALDLTLFTRNKKAPKLGPLSDFLNAIKDELIAIRVTGTLNNPKAEVASFSGAKNTAERLLQAPLP